MSRTKRCEVCGQKKLNVFCITCVEKDMKNWEKRMVQKGKLEERERVLKLIRFNCLYRIRGITIDLENTDNSDYFEGMKEGYKDLLDKLSEIKYLISAVNFKYLSEEERKEFKQLQKEIWGNGE